MSLKEKIIEEMTTDYTGILERNFEQVKQILKISKNGKVEISNKDIYSGEELILLYLIGKAYCKEAGYSDVASVGNKELIEELGKPEGSVKPWTKNLRDKGRIKQDKDSSTAAHYILPQLIETVMKGIVDKKRA